MLRPTSWTSIWVPITMKDRPSVSWKPSPSFLKTRSMAHSSTEGGGHAQPRDLCGLQAKQRLKSDASTKSTLSEIIELLRGFLSNPWNIYETGSLEVRKTILKTAFQAPLAYDRQNGYRTPQAPVIFDFLAYFTSKCEMVRPRRLELPLRLRNSDLNAARLPIPPRPHTVLLVFISC